MKRGLGDRRARHDAFYRRAKSEGFAARAVYKLEEIDRRCSLIRRGDRVLDLGCWPGSWLQYCASRVGPDGRVVGLDVEPVEIRLGPRVRVLRADMREISPEELRGDLGAFDVVLSDAAPNTIGVREADQARSEELFARALDLALALLRPGGRFCGKVFDGPGVPALRARLAAGFRETRDRRPEGSRRGSAERYLVGLGRR